MTDWISLLFSFDGRVGRRVFWLYSLFQIACVALIIGAFAGEGDDPLVAVFVFALITLWPTLAIEVKRLHDIDMSGIWLLLSFMPYVGSLILVVLMGFFPGTPGENRYGPSPRQSGMLA